MDAMIHYLTNMDNKIRITFLIIFRIIVINEWIVSKRIRQSALSRFFALQ